MNEKENETNNIGGDIFYLIKSEKETGREIVPHQTPNKCSCKYVKVACALNNHGTEDLNNNSHEQGKVGKN